MSVEQGKAPGHEWQHQTSDRPLGVSPSIGIPWCTLSPNVVDVSIFVLWVHQQGRDAHHVLRLGLLVPVPPVLLNKLELEAFLGGARS